MSTASTVYGQSDQPRQWSPETMMTIKRIGSVQVSPDGRRVAFAVREAIMDGDQSEFRTQIFVANADGSDQRQLTRGQKSSDDPQWSPDGKWLCFVSNRDDEEGVASKKNLWLMRVDGGEAIRLTAMKGDVSGFKWSPNSRSIALTALDSETPDEQERVRTKNDAIVVDENVKHSRLYVVSVDESPSLQRDLLAISPKDRSIASDAARAGRAALDWSPDSGKIVFAHCQSPQPDDWASSHLSIVDCASSAITDLANTPAAEGTPFYSPDGSSIVFTLSDVPATWAGARRLAIIATSGGSVHLLPETSDGFGRYSEIVGWSADGTKIYFTEMQGTSLRLQAMTRLGAVETLSREDGMSISGVFLNSRRTHIGFGWENFAQPPEAYCSQIDGFQPVRVSHIQPEKLPLEKLGHTEVITWKSTEGFEIEGLLTLPVNHSPGTRYPLLLVIHGGPMGVFSRSFDGTANPYPIATFAAHGYAVLRPNPRGSSGYGRKFRYANYGDWGGGDYRDIMRGVDHVIAQGIADPNRLGVMGWSYGGFMTSWTITQTKRFRAASVGAGVTNLVSFTGTADIPSFLPDYFAGEFWDGWEAYRAHSAVFHVKGVTTPTLIQHGERDLRVPLPQGQELYNALKRQGCTTKMVIYPRTPHGIEEPRLMLDCMKRNVEWFVRYLDNLTGSGNR